MVEAAHADARRLLFALDNDLTTLETGQNSSLEHQAKISQTLHKLQNFIHNIETQLHTQPHARRNIWARKINDLKSQQESHRAAFAKFTTQARSRQIEAEERSALLDRRNQAAHLAISMEEGLGLGSAHTQIDALTGNAMAALAALGEQRSSLKGVERKVLDGATKLGLSGSVLRMIERRHFWDKVLVYSGMLLTIVLIWFMFVHLRNPAPTHSFSHG